MKIQKIIQTTSNVGKEQIKHSLYNKKNLTIVVDTVSINGIKTAEIKDLYKKNRLVKTLFIFFDKTGKRISKFVNLNS